MFPKSIQRSLFLIPQSTTITNFNSMHSFRHGIDDLVYFWNKIILQSILHSGRELFICFVRYVLFYSIIFEFSVNTVEHIFNRVDIWTTWWYAQQFDFSLLSFICSSLGIYSPSWMNKLSAGLQLFLIIFLKFLLIKPAKYAPFIFCIFQRNTYLSHMRCKQ